MILEDYLKERVASRAIASAKIRVQSDVICRLVDDLFDYLKLFNSLDEFESRVLDRDLDKVEIVQELSVFVIPSSVRLIPSDRKTIDVLVKEEMDLPFAAESTYAEFIDLQIKWRNLFKKDISSGMVSLSSLKVPKSLAEVLPVAAFVKDDDSYSCLVRGTESPYMPIILSSQLVSTLFRDDYLNANAKDMIDDYLAPVVY